MTSSNPERLTTALDDVLARLGKGEARDSCLARYPDLAADLGPLVDAWAAFMAYGQAPAPAATHIARRRQEFLRAARQCGDEAVSRGPFTRLFNRIRGAFTSRQERPVLLLVFARIAAAIVLTLGLAGGGGLIAQASLPDSPLYGVKLMIEDAQLLMAPSAGDKAQLSLAFAAERAREIQALAQGGQTIGIEVLERLTEQAGAALRYAAQAGDLEMARLLEQTRGALQASQQALERVGLSAPSVAQEGLRLAEQTMERAQQQAERGLSDPEGFRREYGDTAPPSPRPAGTSQPPAPTSIPGAAPRASATPTPRATALPQPSMTPQHTASPQREGTPGPVATPRRESPRETASPAHSATPGQPGAGSQPTPAHGSGQSMATTQPGERQGPGPQATSSPAPGPGPGNGAGGSDGSGGSGGGHDGKP